MTDTPLPPDPAGPPPLPTQAGDERRFPCKNCGADMTWDPAHDVLVCAHCDARTSVPRADNEIVERPLEAAGEAARGYGLETRTATCDNCGAKISFEGRNTALECAFCGSPAVLETGSFRNPLRPESIIPLAVGAQKAEASFRAWIGSRWFRPSALKSTKQFEARGIYVPCWTYDAIADSQWSADAGFYYTVMEPRPVMVNGRMQVQMVAVQKVRWEPAWGRRHDVHDDVLVHASRGLSADLAAKLGSYDLKELVPYRPEYLAGWRAEEYAVDLEEGWKTALARVVSSQEARCSHDVPGDTQRNLRVHNVVSNVRWKLMLLPVWSLTYRYGGKPYAVLVHGQTGRIVGHAPYSFWKILLFVLAIVGLLGILVLAVSLA